MTKFLLIRHALTDTAGKRLSGRMPGVHLNGEGLKQARDLAERLKEIPISAIYCSPLERAQETAAPLEKQLNLSCFVSDDFEEVDFGEWTNCTIDELKNNILFRRFNTLRSSTRIPGGELMAEAQLRIVNGMENLRARHRNETIAIISHADIIKSAIAWYAGIPLDMFQRIEVSPASVSIIDFYEDTVKILLINETGKIT